MKDKKNIAIIIILFMGLLLTTSQSIYFATTNLYLIEENKVMSSKINQKKICLRLKDMQAVRYCELYYQSLWSGNN